VAALSPEEFDSIEFGAAFSGEHQPAADRMMELARTASQSDAMPRAEAFIRAGEQWLLADDPAAAADAFRLALADGGAASVDPRVPLARAYFQLGEPDQARRLIAALKAEGPAEPRACDLVAELLADYADLPGAMEWATAGVELCLRYADPAPGSEPARAPVPGRLAASVPRQRADEDTELRLLLRLRYRIRNDLGLPEDRYDEMLDET